MRFFYIINMEHIGTYTFKNGGFDEITSDTLLLADFIPPLSEADRVIDICSGSGAIALKLAYKNKKVSIIAVEILEERAAAARANIEANNLTERLSILNIDYRALTEKFPAGAFTHVVANPPFVKKGEGRLSPVFERRVARSEVFGELRDLIPVLTHLAGHVGGIYIIFTLSRLSELLVEMKDNGLRVKRLRFVHPFKGAPACRVLVEAQKGEWVRDEVLEEPLYLR